MTHDYEAALKGLDELPRHEDGELFEMTISEHLFLEAHEKAIKSALQLAMDSGWRSIDSAPKDGTPFYTRYQVPMRWKLYKPNSQQFKAGIEGRWQEMNEYGGWENTDHGPYEWKPHQPPEASE